MKKRLKRIALALCCFVLVCVVAVCAIDIYVRTSVHDLILTEAEASDMQVDCILVLGAGVSHNQPSPILEDRLLQGIALFRNGVSARMLMSGDHGQPDYDEVNVMKRFAVDAGVPADCILMDHAGFSTYESMYRARAVFGARRIIVVTQRYHLSRALYIGRQLGMEVYGVASDPREYTKKIYRETREILARCKDFFYALFEIRPTELGDAIPIDSPGSVTDG